MLRARARRDFTVPTAQPSDSARLRFGESFQVEQDDRACVDAERRERAFDVGRDDVAKALGSGVAAHGLGRRRREVVVEPDVDGIFSRAPIVIDERVSQNPKQPCAQVRARGELRPSRDRARVRFLDEVFRFVVSSRETSCDAIERVELFDRSGRQCGVNLSHRLRIPDLLHANIAHQHPRVVTKR